MVPMTVSNPSGSDQFDILLKPSEPPELFGLLTVDLTQSPDAELVAGQTYTFIYTIHAETTLADTYTLAANVVPSGWQAAVLSTDGSPLTQLSIPQSPSSAGGTDRLVRVDLTIPAGTAITSANLTLSITSDSKPSFNGSRTEALTVGQEAPPPSFVSISVEAVIPPSGSKNAAGEIEVSGTGVDIPVWFSVTVGPQVSGTHTYQILPLEVENDLEGKWTFELMMASDTFPATSGDPPFRVITTLNAQSGAPDTNLLVKVVAQDDATITGSLIQPVKLSGAS
jgi:hypothetical protein